MGVWTVYEQIKSNVFVSVLETLTLSQLSLLLQDTKFNWSKNRVYHDFLIMVVAGVRATGEGPESSARKSLGGSGGRWWNERRDQVRGLQHRKGVGGDQEGTSHLQASLASWPWRRAGLPQSPGSRMGMSPQCCPQSCGQSFSGCKLCRAGGRWSGRDLQTNQASHCWTPGATQGGRKVGIPPQRRR